MKTIYDDGYKQIVDCGLTDYWGRKCYVAIVLDQFAGCLARNRNYKKEKKALEKCGARFVIPQIWLKVIDFNPKMITKIKKLFNVSDDFIKYHFQVWTD
jgi:hypothetical protein